MAKSFVRHPVACLLEVLGEAAKGRVFAWESGLKGPDWIRMGRRNSDVPPLRHGQTEAALGVLSAWAEDFASVTGFAPRSFLVNPAKEGGAGALLDDALANRFVFAFLSAHSDDMPHRIGRGLAPEFILRIGHGTVSDPSVGIRFNFDDPMLPGFRSALLRKAEEWRRKSAGAIAGATFDLRLPIPTKSGHERLEILISEQTPD